MALTWRCNYCPKILPNFKELVDHYREQHEKMLRRYLIRNRNRKERGIVTATSPIEASKFFGWDMKDCKVKEIPL